MAEKTLSQVIGGTHGTILAPNLDWPQTKGVFSLPTVVSGIDASAGLTTILSLTGKFMIYGLWMTTLTTNDLATVKLTIDGVIIWNIDPLTNSTSEMYIGGFLGNHTGSQEAVVCEESFLFQLDTDADTTITLNHLVRPIL